MVELILLPLVDGPESGSGVVLHLPRFSQWTDPQTNFDQGGDTWMISGSELRSGLKLTGAGLDKPKNLQYLLHLFSLAKSVNVEGRLPSTKLLPVALHINVT